MVPSFLSDAHDVIQTRAVDGILRRGCRDADVRQPMQCNAMRCDLIQSSIVVATTAVDACRCTRLATVWQTSSITGLAGASPVAAYRRMCVDAPSFDAVVSGRP